MRSDWKSVLVSRRLVLYVLIIALLGAFGCAKKANKDTPLGVALRIVQSTEDKHDKATLLNFIVIHYASNGEYDKALGLLDAIDDTLSRAQSLISIVGICLEDSQYNRAVQIAESIQHTFNKFFALDLIALDYARNDKSDQAVAFAARSLDVARMIKDDVERARALCIISNTYA